MTAANNTPALTIAQRAAKQGKPVKGYLLKVTIRPGVIRYQYPDGSCLDYYRMADKVVVL